MALRSPGLVACNAVVFTDPRVSWFVSADHVFADAALSDVEAKFEQFAVDAGCTPTPKGILPAHLADEISDLARNDGSSRLAVAHLPDPEEAKAGSMPSHDRFWLDDGLR